MKIEFSKLFLIIIFSVQLYAQNTNLFVEGTVLDIENNSPLINTFIFSNDHSNGIEVDSNGRFTLNLDSKSEEIYFSHIGYKTKSIRKRDIQNNNLIICLSPLSTMLQEIAVYSDYIVDTNINYDANALSLKSNLVKKISNVMPDVLRAFQAFPGISTNNEFSAEFNVRGGNKDENLILLDGTELLEPYHLRGAPNASVGIFNVDLIKGVNLITGGFSARYGDRLSSVTNVKFKEGDFDKYSGAFTLSLAFLDGYVEGPLFKNSSFIFGVRKTYMEYLLDLTDFGYNEIKSASPSFYDIQGKLTFNLSKNNKINFSFIHSRDKLKYNPSSISEKNNIEELFNGENSMYSSQSSYFEDIDGSYESSIVDLQIINIFNIFNKSSFLKTNISYLSQKDFESRNWGTTYSKEISASNMYFESKIREDITSINLKAQSIEIRSDFDIQSTPFLENIIGFNFKKLFFKDLFYYKKNAISSSNILTYPDTLIYDYGYVGLDYRQDSLIFDAYKSAVYLESIFQFGDDFIANISGRVDYFNLNKQLTISPRFNMVYSFNSKTTFRAAFGKYYQSPIISQIEYSSVSDTNTRSQTAIHYVFGLEQEIDINSKLNKKIKLKLDYFYKDYQNLISAFFAHSDRLAYSRKNDANGYAYGLDLFLSLNIPSFYSWVSYSYLISKEDNLKDNYEDYPRLSGQTHTLAWITDVQLGKNWSFNSKFFYGSGFPYAEKKIEYSEERKNYFWTKEYVNTKYLPPYQRIDFRLTKIIKFEKFFLNFFVEVSNALNHKNIRGYDFSYDVNGFPTTTEVTLWPILPSFGIKLQF